MQLIHLLILGCDDAKNCHKDAYKIPVVTITASIDQQHNSDTPTEWTKPIAADHWSTARVLSSSPPAVVGGEDENDKTTADGQRFGH